MVVNYSTLEGDGHRHAEQPGSPRSTLSQTLTSEPSFGEYAPPEANCPLFILLTFVACMAALALELYKNGQGQDPLGPKNDDCYYRTEVQGYFFCAASLGRNPLLGPDNKVLIEMGAKEGDAIVNHGDVWRLVAPLYLHGGVFHCGPNMLVLLQLGWPLERRHGFLKVGTIYMLSGIFGIMMSTVLAPHMVSVGASGAIMGLLGACIGEVIQNWRVFARPCVALCQISIGAALQLALGTMPMVDNFAHAFGFVMGVTSSLALLVLDPVTSSGRPLSTKCHNRLFQIVAAALTYLCFVGGLVALYGEWDATELCPLCRKIGCTPFPWGCDPSSKGDCWWDCSNCATSGVSGRVSWVGTPQNGTVSLQCPLLHKNGLGELYETVLVPNVDTSHFKQWGSSELIPLCKAHCPEAYA